MTTCLSEEWACELADQLYNQALQAPAYAPRQRALQNLLDSSDKEQKGRKRTEDGFKNKSSLTPYFRKLSN